MKQNNYQKRYYCHNIYNIAVKLSCVGLLFYVYSLYICVLQQLIPLLLLLPLFLLLPLLHFLLLLLLLLHYIYSGTEELQASGPAYIPFSQRASKTDMAASAAMKQMKGPRGRRDGQSREGAAERAIQETMKDYQK
jgi:hypothetical protein